MQPDEMSPIQPPTPPRPNVPGVDEPQPPQQLLGYDATGRPLYGVPAIQPESNVQNLGTAFQNQAADPLVPVRTIQAPRLVDINPSVVRTDNHPDDIAAKHAQSVREYPDLNLSDAEYVLSMVRRHLIGVITPLIGGVVLICVILVIIFSYPTVIAHFDIVKQAPNAGIVALVGLVIAAIVAAMTYASVWVFQANRLFLTNESIIQEIQQSLFVKREQTLSLGNVEDVSFTQTGILQTMLNYGSIRLTTEGEETEYHLDYVKSPRQQAGELTSAVENFKNGRQVNTD